MDEDKLTITIIEAARRLGISKGLAYRMAKENRLPIIRFGHRMVIPLKALDDLLSNPASDLRQLINTRDKN